MTSSTNPSESSPAQVPAAGMLESSRGSILQRGGEELAVEKVNDRFTVRPNSTEALENLTQQLSAKPGHTVEPAEQLTEFIVDPAQREQQMQQARSMAGVAYASHVYRLKTSPNTLIYTTNQLTVQFAPQVPEATVDSIAAEVGIERIRPVTGIPNTFIFCMTDRATENPIKIANWLMMRSEVLMAEPNVVVKAQPLYKPRDPLYPKQWHLHHNGGADLTSGSHVFAEQAWDITRGSRSIVVAVMDDAIDINHPDFQGKGKIVAPRDFKDQDFLPVPVEFGEDHGTACAGVAVAEENGVGVVGVAPGCALMPLRTTGYLDDDAIEELFDWAAKKGASVISCSWGPSAIYFPLSLRQRAALTRAATEGRNGKGCVIVFASGNSNRPTNGTVNEQGWQGNALNGPTRWLGGFAVHPDVIAVSASTSFNKKSAYSNWGTEISVCAPSNNAPPGAWLEQTGFIPTGPEITTPLAGLGIFTVDRLGNAGYNQSNFADDFGGTSSACPLVAGVAALVLSANPDLTAQEVKRILQETADKIVDPDPDPQLKQRKGSYETNGHSLWFGYGKVNAFKAVQAALRHQVGLAAATRQISLPNNTSQPIPDAEPNGLVSAVQANDANPVRNIQVTVNIAHSFLGDLEVSLIAPNGRTVLLQSRNLGRKTTLQTTYTLQTSPHLRTLLNQPAKGRWQLKVADFAQSDTGTLNSWQLTLGV